MYRLFAFLIVGLLVASCAINERLLITGNSADRAEVARVRISATNKPGSDPYKLGTGSHIVEIVHKGKSYFPKDGVVQLNAGSYIFKVKWWRVTKESSMFFPVAGTVMFLPDGNLLHADGTYDFEVTAKVGKTYVIDMEPTVHFFDHPPEKLCLTEEDHDAVGVTYPRVGKINRFPSPNAPKISCVTLTKKDA